MSIQRIVIGTDFSEHSAVAVRQAMHIARHTGAELVLVHALSMTEAQIPWVERSFGHPDALRKLLRDALSRGHDDLERQFERLRGQGVQISQLLVDAREHEGLRDAALRIGAQLIVVGSHGQGREPWFGGVAHKVAREFEGDVLIARDDRGAGGFRKILVPVDLSADSGPLIETAKSLAAPDAEIDIVHAWMLPSVLSGYAAEAGVAITSVTEDIADAARLACEELLTAHRDARFRLVTHAIPGVARTAILEHARAGNFDLIVIGSHGRKGLARVVLGSVAEAVMRGAPSSVLVVRGPSGPRL